MIGEATAYTGNVQSEQISRANSGREVARQRAETEQEVSQQETRGSDTVSLSPEARAQARNVAPAGEAVGSDGADQTTRNQGASPGQEAVYRGSSIDLRV